MEETLPFLNGEKNLFLVAGVFGVLSLIAGILFLFIGNYKSFSITMILLGLLETLIMFPGYLNFQNKIEKKTWVYNQNKTDFVSSEIKETEKSLKSIIKVKLIYCFLLVLICIAITILKTKSLLFGIGTAFVFHLALAITIDNFAQINTEKYLNEIRIKMKE